MAVEVALEAGGSAVHEVAGGLGRLVFNDFSPEATEDAKVVNGEGEHEWPGADAEHADEEVGNDVFWDGSADEKEESGKEASEFPRPCGKWRAATVKAVERADRGEGSAGPGEEEPGGEGCQNDGDGGDEEGVDEGFFAGVVPE